ncbi:CusA/CzcA family heavy metal efflux RND transporter [Actimicrobium sp. CCC2.4]|uniref:efflux RND transporter permease subunit n=1 Tax=Actimicrobium sp. CCC2.4 TaxID=3048606 RepID=UPI002AC9AB27|nr:CusA/CzcA family heavy metal efflux RND transporter [Actimicrobium sp. CCC2.4]MEB0136360.1 CusA/CzcA family heavy metal efflux RND transporter [Actimicrobium sp. CCC2.4]WPX31179.1 CusA/CzcA family heavy metal efflux RND transporter [Actimicrobium sp. CCC2.4]
MLDKLIDFVLAQRVFVLILTLALTLFGYRALTNLPIEAFPDVQDVQVQIVTQFPGQAPEEVERAITLPIEREMSGVPHQTQLRSVTLTGLSVVTLTFADGTDDYFARQQVLEKLGNVTLPTGIQPSLAPLTTAVGEIFRYIVDAPAGMDANAVRALQDWVIRPGLRIVPGVADVVSFGGTVKEYQVQIDPAALKRYNVTLDQVSQALTNNSANVGGGLVRRGDEALVVRGIGIFNRLDDIGRVMVSAKNGNTVLVSDVATVTTGFRPRSGVVAYNDNDSVVEGIVQMTKGSNAAKVVADVKLRIAAINAKLPSGVRLKTIYDRTELIDHTVKTVAENLLVGAGLVIAILMLFLGNWRAALIVATVIPLSLLCAFIMLDARGIPANLISLGAVDFGIIIDSAVVLVEALMVRLALQTYDPASGLSATAWRTRTLKETVVQLGHPILFAKAIIILAFIPIYTFQRVEGKIFSPVAFTISFAMVGAIILTMTLVPTLLAWTMQRHPMAEKHSHWMTAIQSWYRRMLNGAQQRRKLVFGCAAVALVLTMGLAPMLGSEFLPKLDEGNIWLTISLPNSSSLEKTRAMEQQVRAILKSYPEVNNVLSHIGRPDDGTDPKGPNNMEILADLKPHASWNFKDKEALVADMTEKIHHLPGLPTNFSQVIQDNVEEALSGVKGEIAIKIFGPDLAILSQKSEQVAAILSTIQGAADVAAVKIGGQSELDIVMDRERIARLGINVADVNTAIQTALAGNAVNVYYEGDRRFDIVIRLQEESRNSVDDIAALQISLPGATGTVALGDLARIDIRQGPARISREAGERNASVKANLLGRDQGSFVAEAQQKVAAQVHLPPGYQISWGGQFENQQRAVKRLEVIVPITGLLIFSLLFWAFKSVPKALLVLAIVPFALIGGIVGLALAGLHFSVSAAVGFIAVAGISVQNGVIMVEQMVENGRTDKNGFASSVEGAVSRLRPILMTALMAGLGLLPAALSHGIGSETQRPFAVVIVGGIVSATFFTLLLLPLAYAWFSDKQNKQDKQSNEEI